MRNSFNIDRSLSRFFPDNTLQFRSLQASTGTVISGSYALQFFDRSHYPESDLDIYVPFGSQRAIGEFLLGIGYNFMPSRSQSPTFDAAIGRGGAYHHPRCTTYSTRARAFHAVLDVFTFNKPSLSRSTLKVQVIVTESNPMEAIFNFHSSTLYSCHSNASHSSTLSLCHECNNLEICLLPLSQSDLRREANAYLSR